MTNPTHPQKAPRWSREEIRSARGAPLGPLLREQGLSLLEREAGNTIDFYMRILKMTFHQAMLIITKG